MKQITTIIALLMLGALPLIVFLGPGLHISLPGIVAFLLLDLLLLGAIALWRHAHADSNGGEPWWDDDSASGWRGY